MLGIKIDPDLDWILDNEVSDLAKYNVLRYFWDHPDESFQAKVIADELGLRSLETISEDLESLSRYGFLEPSITEGDTRLYRLTSEPSRKSLVGRLCGLTQSGDYGQIVARLASRSLKRVRKAAEAARGTKRGSLRSD